MAPLKPGPKPRRPELPEDYKPIQEITVRRKDFKEVAHERIYGPCRDPECDVLNPESQHGETAFPNNKVYEKGAYMDSFKRVKGEDGGLKNDKGKLDWWLFPFDAFEGVVEILMYGAKKYDEENWKNVKNRRNFAALIRHLIKWRNGEEFDPESGLHHLDHALCDLMFIVYNLKAR